MCACVCYDVTAARGGVREIVVSAEYAGECLPSPVVSRAANANSEASRVTVVARPVSRAEHVTRNDERRSSAGDRACVAALVSRARPEDLSLCPVTLSPLVPRTVFSNSFPFRVRRATGPPRRHASTSPDPEEFREPTVPSPTSRRETAPVNNRDCLPIPQRR